MTDYLVVSAVTKIRFRICTVSCFLLGISCGLIKQYAGNNGATDMSELVLCMAFVPMPHQFCALKEGTPFLAFCCDLVQALDC